jgi:hypothetical protein
VETLNPEAVAEDLDSYVLRPSKWIRDDRGFAVLIDGPESPAIMRFACQLRFGAARAWILNRH